jgi:toxin ParE1/3/4
MRLFLSSPARADIDEIWSYIATESGSAEIADRVIASISETFRLLRRNPNLGRRRDGDLRQEIRSFPAGNHMIFYRSRAAAVEIVRVLHGSRDIGRILGRP